MSPIDVFLHVNRPHKATHQGGHVTQGKSRSRNILDSCNSSDGSHDVQAIFVNPVSNSPVRNSPALCGGRRSFQPSGKSSKSSSCKSNSAEECTSNHMSSNGVLECLIIIDLIPPGCKPEREHKHGDLNRQRRQNTNCKTDPHVRHSSANGASPDRHERKRRTRTLLKTTVKLSKSAHSQQRYLNGLQAHRSGLRILSIVLAAYRLPKSHYPTIHCPPARTRQTYQAHRTHQTYRTLWELTNPMPVRYRP